MGREVLLNKIRSFREYLIYALAFALPLSEKLSTLLILINSVIAISVFRKSHLVLFFKTGFPIVLLYLVYVMAYARDVGGFGLNLFETKASLLAFPLIIFGTDILIRKNVLKYFLYGSLVSYVICIVVAVCASFNNYTLNFIEVSSVPNGEIGFFQAIDYNANRLLGSAFISTGIQRAYLAMYFAFALCIVWLGVGDRKKGTKLVFSTLLCLGILQTWSLAGLISLLFIAAYLIFVVIKNRGVKFIFFLALLFSFAAIVSFNNRANFMYKTIVSGNLNLEGPTATTVRLRPWLAAINLIGQKPISGYGMDTSQKSLNAYYQSQLEKNPRYQWPLDESFNAHNQYLQFLLESGLIGLAVFALVFISFILNLKIYPTDFRLIGWGFLILILLNFLFESMMSRYVGISFFAFFYSLFIPSKKENDSKESYR